MELLWSLYALMDKSVRESRVFLEICFQMEDTWNESSIFNLFDFFLSEKLKYGVLPSILLSGFFFFFFGMVLVVSLLPC